MKQKMRLFLLSTISAIAPALVFADSGCTDFKRDELGQAIGTLIYDSVVKEYKSVVDVEAIVTGIIEASGSNEISIVNNQGASGDGSGKVMTVAKAEGVVKKWRTQTTDRVGERFEEEFKRGKTETKDGLIFNRRLLTVEQTDSFAKCFEESYRISDKDKKHVCFISILIDEKAVCNVNEVVESLLDDVVKGEKQLTYGSYDSSDVISGWSEAFDILEKDELEGTRTPDTTRVTEVLEIVVPSELGYGKKGIANKVAPDETLWFMMAVR